MITKIDEIFWATKENDNYIFCYDNTLFEKILCISRNRELVEHFGKFQEEKQ